MQIKPLKKWRRPWFKVKEIPFQVQLKPLDSYPLKVDQVSGNLYWSPRPWWQFLLAILLFLLLLGGAGWLIYKIIKYTDFNPPKFDPNNPGELKSFYDLYNYDDTILLNFKINHLQFRPENTVIHIFEGETEIQDSPFQVQKLLENSQINSPEDNKDYDSACVYNDQLYQLSCLNINTGISEPGDYKFTLKATNKNSDKKGPVIQSNLISIYEPPKPKINEVKLSRNQIKPGDKIDLSLLLDNYEQIETLKISPNSTNGGSSNSLLDSEMILEKEEIERYCQNSNQDSKCTLNIPWTIAEGGNYEFTVTATSFYDQHNETPIQMTSDTITVKIPLKIDYFKANGKSYNIDSVNAGDTIYLDWSVLGNGVKVQIDYLPPNLDARGKAELYSYPNDNFYINLKATDKFGDTVQQRLFIPVIKNDLGFPQIDQDRLPNRVIEVPDILR